MWDVTRAMSMIQLALKIDDSDNRRIGGDHSVGYGQCRFPCRNPDDRVTLARTQSIDSDDRIRGPATIPGRWLNEAKPETVEGVILDGGYDCPTDASQLHAMSALLAEDRGAVFVDLVDYADDDCINRYIG